MRRKEEEKEGEAGHIFRAKVRPDSATEDCR